MPWNNATGGDKKVAWVSPLRYDLVVQHPGAVCLRAAEALHRRAQSSGRTAALDAHMAQCLVAG